VFALTSFVQAGIIFMSKSRASLLHFVGRFLAVILNVRLDCIMLTETNPPAYFSGAPVNKKKAYNIHIRNSLIG
jgi:hypothetical protein